LRGVALLAVAGVFSVFGYIAGTASNRGKVLATLGFVVVGVWGWTRFSKERAILRRCASATGTVTEFSKDSGSEGGASYEIEYQFAAADGASYDNSSRSNRELPEQGNLIEILYDRENPAKNMPRELFWFYDW
jgi:hypothetical protein